MEIDAVIDGINHEIRRKIMVLLAERGQMKYSSLLAEIGIQSGVLNYHLSKMESLLKKDQEGIYSLNNKGILAYRLLNFLQEEIKRPQSLIRPSLSPWSFLSEAGRSFIDLFTNPRRAFTYKGKGEVLTSFVVGTLILLISAFLGVKSLLEVAFMLIGTIF